MDNDERAPGVRIPHDSDSDAPPSTHMTPRRENLADLALGTFNAPSEPAAAPGVQTMDLQAMAFGKSARKKAKSKAKKPRRKGSSIAPDDGDPNCGSPAAKTSGKKVKRKKSRKKDEDESNNNGTRTSSLLCCCCSVLMFPFRRCWNYCTRKLLCGQYLRSVCQIVSNYVSRDLRYNRKHGLVLLGLLVSMVTELFKLSPNYNTFVFCMLLGSAQFTMFPINTMRPQVTCVLLHCVLIFETNALLLTDLRGCADHAVHGFGYLLPHYIPREEQVFVGGESVREHHVVLQGRGDIELLVGGAGHWQGEEVFGQKVRE